MLTEAKATSEISVHIPRFLDLVGSAKRPSAQTLEALLADGAGNTLQIVWEPSYTSAVYNPDPDLLLAMALGRHPTPLNPDKMKLLYGVKSNGKCPWLCDGCTFAMDQSLDENFSSSPISVSPEYQTALMNTAVQLANESGLLKPGDKFGAGGLLSGDASGHEDLARLMYVTGTYPNCVSNRVSTIAPVVKGRHVLKDIVSGAALVKSVNENHVVTVQVSLHSTDPEQRRLHVAKRRNNVHLLSAEEISAESELVYLTTGRKLALAFVVQEATKLDPDTLAGTFSPEHNMVSLRPIFSSTHRQMPAPELVNIYTALRSRGFDVVYIPPSQNATELDNLRRPQGL